MKNVLFCVVMGLLLIGCSQNDEIIRQNPENVVSKAVTASGYRLSSYSVGLTTPSGSDFVRILDSNGNSAWVHWSTDADLTDATVESSGFGPSITISAKGDHPYGSVNVWVNGKNIGPVLVHKKSTGGGGGRDTTLLDSVSGVDLQ